MIPNIDSAMFVSAVGVVAAAGVTVWRVNDMAMRIAKLESALSGLAEKLAVSASERKNFEKRLDWIEHRVYKDHPGHPE